jgi:hypothetical protein
MSCHGAIATVTKPLISPDRKITEKIIPPPSLFYFQNFALKFTAGASKSPQSAENPRAIPAQNAISESDADVRQNAPVVPQCEKPLRRGGVLSRKSGALTSCKIPLKPQHQSGHG